MGINRIALCTMAAWVCALPALTSQLRAQTIDQAEKQAVVAKAGEMLVERYVFPDRGAQAKAKMDKELAAGDYDTITDPGLFAAQLTATLQSVTHDKHMRVSLNNPPPAPPRN